MKFCSQCASPVSLQIPEGDDRPRYMCTHCDRIHYHNPRIITGCIPLYEDRVLLCRRAIEPRAGFWTLPAGYLENGETIAEGALRESREEANLALTDIRLYAVVDIPHIQQVYMMHIAPLGEPVFSPGAESLETRLFHRTEIPWGELAFPVIDWVLERFFSDRERGDFTVVSGRLHPQPDYFAPTATDPATD